MTRYVICRQYKGGDEEYLNPYNGIWMLSLIGETLWINPPTDLISLYNYGGYTCYIRKVKVTLGAKINA